MEHPTFLRKTNVPYMNYYTPYQIILPTEQSVLLKSDDPVITLDKVLSEVNIEKYLISNFSRDHRGRKRYNPVSLLKVVLYGFTIKGYISFRQLEDACFNDIRFRYLLRYEKNFPTHMTLCNFVNNSLKYNINEIFNEINQYIFKQDNVDLDHVYIDGTKYEANANKYTWVWKKACISNRNKLFDRITKALKEINLDLAFIGLYFEIKDEYTPEYIEEIIKQFKYYYQIDETKIPSGKGHHKTTCQKQYEFLKLSLNRLYSYSDKIDICGEERNSYSKTDKDATFMRIKTDYMGNDQLLPAYNVQFGICDGYISVLDVNRHASDMDCFIPLINNFYKQYGFYPKYPIADAGYGSLNNYDFCEKVGMEKYMKYPTFERETKNKKYRENIFNSSNFKINQNGNPVCPLGREFHKIYNRPIKGNMFGRVEEIYECEDCSNCPLKRNCTKASKNRKISLNHELTKYHKEVYNNINSIHGALLMMNRSIQSEGTFGIIKQDKTYRRIWRRGIEQVTLEFYLISIGYNIKKYHTKKK